MGQEARKAVDRLQEIGSGRSRSLRELDETRGPFQVRLKKTLSNLPRPEASEGKETMIQTYRIAESSDGETYLINEGELGRIALSPVEDRPNKGHLFKAVPHHFGGPIVLEHGVETDSPGDRAAQEAASRPSETG